MKYWPNRYVFALVLFIIGVLIGVNAYFDLHNHPGDYGPGSGLVFILSIPAAIIGYVLGGIVDFFTRRK